jgi:hypothetical protein
MIGPPDLGGCREAVQIRHDGNPSLAFMTKRLMAEGFSPNPTLPSQLSASRQGRLIDVWLHQAFRLLCLPGRPPCGDFLLTVARRAGCSPLSYVKTRLAFTIP